MNKIFSIWTIGLVLFYTLPSSATETVIKGQFHYQSNTLNQISIRQFSFLNASSLFLAKTNVQPDSTFTLKFDLEEPVLAFIFNNMIFVTPGDSVNMDFYSARNFKVTGKNAGNYLFFTYIKNIELPRSQHYTDFQNYKSDLKSHFNNIEAHLGDFSKNYDVSPDFVKYFLGETEYKYYCSLLEYSLRGREINKKELQDEIKSGALNSGFFSSNYYIMFLNDYISFLNDNRRSTIADTQNWWEIMNRTLAGKEKETLFFYKFCFLAKNEDRSYKPLIDSLYKAYNHTFTNPEFNIEISECYNGFVQNLDKIPKRVLSSILNTENGTKNSIHDVLDIHKGKLIYIDMWATWCGPCLKDMPESARLKEHFKDRNIAFLYLSIDENKERWKELISEDKYKNLSGSYLLENGLKSQWVQYFKINNIPRYILLDENREIISSNAPGPSMHEAKLLIDQNLN